MICNASPLGKNIFERGRDHSFLGLGFDATVFVSIRSLPVGRHGAVACSLDCHHHQKVSKTRTYSGLELEAFVFISRLALSIHSLPVLRRWSMQLRLPSSPERRLSAISFVRQSAGRRFVKGDKDKGRCQSHPKIHGISLVHVATRLKKMPEQGSLLQYETA